MAVKSMSRWRLVVSIILAWPLASGFAATRAATPTPEQALKLVPVQRDVDYDQPSPEEAAKCTIKAEKHKGQTGWVIRDAQGKILREFVDTNGDNIVDRWSYYKDGVEVYRDIDTKFTGKANEFRWLNTAGIRWGAGKSSDGQIDAWRMISAEETSAEAVMAIRDRDPARFARLLLTSSELKLLALNPAKSKELAEKLAAAPAAFAELVRRQNTITAKSNWVHFGGSRPGIVPAGTFGIPGDLVVYENVVAIVETEGKDAQLQIGTMIKVGECWRLIDAPAIPDANAKSAEIAGNGFFFVNPAIKNAGQSADSVAGGTNEKTQKLLEELQRLDDAIGKAGTRDAQAKLNEERADYLQQIISEIGDKDRAQWVRQMADTVSAAVQSGTFPKGTERLTRLGQSLEKNPADGDLAAYVEFRKLTAEYVLALQAPNPEFSKVQAEWVKSLEQFVGRHPKAPDAADAMMQLGVAEEFAGQEDKAKHWYGEIAGNFDGVAVAKKAAGAIRRLDSVGKSVELVGRSTAGEQVDLSQYRGKFVLIHYWATTSEPCKVDLAELKELQARYAASGFALIGVSLDGDRAALDDYLSRNRLPWPQLFEPGGLDSRYANELGILTLPTMILIDDTGKVINRGIHISELDGELRAKLK
ncbi:MAG TPA: redoxin family protein [Pirellulales bacterium]|nr:redoxin family protein [Pirellulales bacterium]